MIPGTACGYRAHREPARRGGDGGKRVICFQELLTAGASVNSGIRREISGRLMGVAAKGTRAGGGRAARRARHEPASALNLAAHGPHVLAARGAGPQTEAPANAVTSNVRGTGGPSDAQTMRTLVSHDSWQPAATSKRLRSRTASVYVSSSLVLERAATRSRRKMTAGEKWKGRIQGDAPRVPEQGHVSRAPRNGVAS